MSSWAGSCPVASPLNSESMNPVGLNAYLKKNSSQIKDLGDVICCLPDQYKENVVIAFDSVAAQPGTIRSPRVIFFDNHTPENPMKAILSVNGGSPGQAQNNSLEVMFNRSQNSPQLELRDFEFKKGMVHMSGANPETCMNCHSGVENDPHGPRAIFEPFDQWTRFVDGVDPCSANELELYNEIRKATLDSVKKNSRFRCLKPEVFDQLPSRLTHLDGALTQFQSRRTAQMIRQTPDFQSYKYALVGLGYCQLIDRKYEDPETWIPEHVISQHQSQEFMLPVVQKSKDVWKTLKQEIEKSVADFKVTDSKQSLVIEQIRKGKEIELPIFRGSHCRASNENLVSQIRSEVPKSLERWHVDASLRGFRGQIDAVQLRYFFDGRGIDTSNWNRGAVPGDNDRPDLKLIAPHILDLETKSSGLAGLKEELRAIGKKQRPDEIQRNRQVCEKIHKLSLSAFDQRKAPLAEPTKTRK